VRGSVIAAFPLLVILSSSTYAHGSAADQTASGAAQSTFGARDEEEIRKILADFVNAWNKHDAKAFSMVFAEDADFTNLRGTSAKGPEGQDIPLRKGLLNFVITKEGDKWLILVMHNMDLPAAP
jgi:ketosteroid isomerase-like protein